jgi:riboflavin synthase
VFTGLIEAVGRVAEVRPAGGGRVLAIACERPLPDLRLGESIAVDGVCLTVTAQQHDRRFQVDVSAESVERSILGSLQVGARVNLERALALGDRLGGHLVSGHVDGRGTLAARAADGTSLRLTFGAASDLCRLLVPKGSVSVQGVSLTINELSEESFGINLVPHSQAETTLPDLAVGDEVNLELDMLVKMVQRLLAPYRDGEGAGKKPDISLDLLARSGFIGAPSGRRGGGGRK